MIWFNNLMVTLPKVELMAINISVHNNGVSVVTSGTFCLHRLPHSDILAEVQC
jgi:hypothetical protein